LTAKRRIMILRLMGIIMESPYLVPERKLLIVFNKPSGAARATLKGLTVPARILNGRVKRFFEHRTSNIER